MKGTMDYTSPLFQYKKELMDGGHENELGEGCEHHDDEEENPVIRSSMHWEEFFGSSLDLTPALLSIYDSIAARTNGKVTCSYHDDQIQKGNQNVEAEDEIVDNLCTMTSSSSVLNVDQDRKKRPLSISSMSSSSSSSLPRNTHKRPNLTPGDDSGNTVLNDKLDHLLYIDDEVPSGTTDEEMSIDTDSKSSAEKLHSISDLTVSHSSLNSPSVNQHEDSSFCNTPEHPKHNSSDSPHHLYQQDHSNYNTPENVQRQDNSSPQKYVSYVHRVVSEIIDTERIYINNLRDILEGYMGFIRNSPDLKIPDDDIISLFGNIEQIYDFGREFLEQLEKCGVDPIKVAECFVHNNDGFKIYAEYCTNYPSAVEILTKIMKDPDLSEVFKHQQLSLCHNLPLGAYLLKPVQRILKYHLLLQNILKNYNKTEPGHETLTQAFNHMTRMAHHINEMKRKHEHAVRVQEIQSQLEDYEGEDLTRLGELVLEGSFRIYGAKTSRQVFLFERGVLIGKRREDGMLSCRTFIPCSNLMLVESIPKEPLSFQVIPFDNPRGQHTLQARNLEQKRKWCQEIKRLIIESFKGKIPEKVKGLVMQLGKSREEESAKLSTVDPRKIYHHNAPEYLERRQRMRRKSGTLLTDLLKPQRKKGQRRAESVSPRSSPPQERKTLVPSPSTPNTRSLYEENNSSIDNTPQSPVMTAVKAVGRSVSFRQAVKRQPLRSVDFGRAEDKENNSLQGHETPTSRRNKSFKKATKHHSLLSASTDELSSTREDNSTKLSLRPELSLPCTPSELSPQTFKEYSRTHSQSNGEKESLYKNCRYSSMPVLNVLEPSSPLNPRSRKASVDTEKNENTASMKKRIFDTKLYFQRRESENKPDVNNLRRGSNSVSAFNDSYIGKSTENLAQKTGPIKLTKPKPFTCTLNVKPFNKSLSLGAQTNDNDDPWEPKQSMLSVPRNSNRTHSVGENDIDKMDWLVYANRNSLPVNGFELGPKLYKYCTPPRSAMDSAHAQIKQNHEDNVLDNLQKCINKTKHPFHVSKSENCLDSDYKAEEQNDFPNFGTLPVIKVASSQQKLNRSISNPVSSFDSSKKLPRHSSPSLFDYHLVKDHEQIIAEMEDYMKKSESTSTVSSVKFPSNMGHNPEPTNKRDSCLSNLSASSYESTDTAPSSPGVDNILGSLKNKIFDLKQKLSHRRSGSYDNKESSDYETDEKQKSKEIRTSLLSLFSNKQKDCYNTDLQSVLHAGDLGSRTMGQRMAEQEPTYIDITLKHKDRSEGKGEKQSQNLHLQNCDSAFSIQGDMAFGNTTEDSPRSTDDQSKMSRKQSGDSIYERQLSVAFDEGEVFRDSAVYCEMDPDHSTSKQDVQLPNRVQIKSYVQKLEEKSKTIQPSVVKVKQREPGAIIKQRLESLHTNSYKSDSRPTSVERELRFYSRPSSVERELRFPNRPLSEERRIRSVSVDPELPPFTSKKSDKPLLRREKSDFSYPQNSQLTPAISTSRIEQLTADVNHLIVMRGWVQQLIEKFQTK